MTIPSAHGHHRQPVKVSEPDHVGSRTIRWFNSESSGGLGCRFPIDSMGMRSGQVLSGASSTLTEGAVAYSQVRQSLPLSLQASPTGQGFCHSGRPIHALIERYQIRLTYTLLLAKAVGPNQAANPLMEIGLIVQATRTTFACDLS
jgi:hypothetical protein